MRTLLIDGDIFAYEAAVAEQKVILGDPDEAWTIADADLGRENLDARLNGLKDLLDADEVFVALTPTGDPSNFRRAILPTYKENRKEVQRPIILEEMKDHLRTAWAAKLKPTLEADDILGIVATNPKLHAGEKVIVSMDKDLKTIPGLHWNPDKDDDIRKVSLEAADRFHLYQTLIGDDVDNYAGCPGVGPVKAELALNSGGGWEPYTHTFKRGPRKGTTETRWRDVTMDDPWAVVVSHFLKAGLTEADALIQAQVARILRHSDFDYRTNKAIPWTPYK
jgi:DNA polymerase-1